MTLTEAIHVGVFKPGTTSHFGNSKTLPPGTQIKSLISYGSNGPKHFEFSLDKGETWGRGVSWGDLR